MKSAPWFAFAGAPAGSALGAVIARSGTPSPSRSPMPATPYPKKSPATISDSGMPPEPAPILTASRGERSRFMKIT